MKLWQGGKISSMGKVQLRMPSSIADTLNEKSSDWCVFEKEIGEGATMGDLLAELTSSYDGFRKAVFNPDIGKISDQIMVFLNDNLLQDPGVTDAKLNDRDSIMFLPVYSGG